MNHWTRREWIAAALAAAATEAAQAEGLPAAHPRVLITPEMVREMAAKVKGPFAAEYRLLTEAARQGPQGLESQWNIPAAFMEAGLAWLIERELGRDGRPYAEKVLAAWRQPVFQKPGMGRHFGWQGLLYDWLYDAMSEEERARYGELLAEWVGTWWNDGTVNIPRSGWWYNQHWGPEHLDEPHNRVALTSKLFMSGAATGHGGRFEGALARSLATFRERFLADGLPALEQMGGVWAESNGHGTYGPLLTVPLGYQALTTLLDFDPWKASGPHGFAREFMQYAVRTMTPHNLKMAWIDDCSGGYPTQASRVAPLFARHYRDGVARWLSDLALERHWLRSRATGKDEVWERIAWLPEDVPATAPWKAGWPLAYHFRGAGHVYMLGAWNDPDATWAFFGAGPSYAGHSRDDEGHFLICRRGQLVNRSGGQGANDYCYYTGGSLVFNIITVYHPEERMRRSQHNENDGGLVRHVYEDKLPIERGHITAYWHDDGLGTYAAADLTKGYWSGKVREVTRQFLYLRGRQECFVIFDRVEATAPELPKHWFLHLPSEPRVNGEAEVKVDGHVVSYRGDTSSWTGNPAGDTEVISSGASRAVMQTLAPAGARITKRGGEGHEFWGHPSNPEAQYNHTLDNRGVERPQYRRPPYSPWRLEVEAPGQRAREYFLHVLFVGDEGGAEPARAQRIEGNEQLGARIPLGERTVTVMFALSGPAGGTLKIQRGGETLWDGALPQDLA